MNEYTNYPPHHYFNRVLKSCPRSALVYVDLWKARTDEPKISIKKKDIRKNFLVSPTLFRNLLTPLAFLNLISFREDETKYSIEIMGKSVDV